MIDHPSQARRGQSPFPDRLHVVAVLNNPMRWQSRLKHFSAFEKRVIDNGGILYVVELAFGDREFEIVQAGNPRHLGLRTIDELWHKERLIRLAIQHLLPSDARYVAWWDADIAFAKSNVCQEILHALQHHYIVQCFSHAVDLGPHDEPMWTTPGFMHEWVNEGALQGLNLGSSNGSASSWNPVSYYDATREAGRGWSPMNDQFGRDWKICHPGLAWAADREALDKIDGGIFDYSIYGSGDWVMALAWVGLAHMALGGRSDSRFSELVMNYQARCEEHIHRDVGYVPGSVLHYWHGRKADRRYAVRPNAILSELGYDPSKDILRDTHGLYRLSTSADRRSQQLRDTLRFFARVRNEDGNEV
jgi:hypothetical protein